MVKTNEAEQFNKYENRGAYHWEWYEANQFGYRDLVDLAMRHIPNIRGATVLDVGCGDGFTSFKLYQKGLKVVGIDTSAEGIRLAREKTNNMRWLQPPWLRFTEKIGLNLKKLIRYRQGDLRFRVQSVYDLDPNERYDYVLCHDVIEHVKHPELLIEKVFNVMRKAAIISTPNAKFKNPRQYDYYMWLPEEFLALFGDKKVELVHCDDSKIYAKMSR